MSTKIIVVGIISLIIISIFGFTYSNIPDRSIEFKDIKEISTEIRQCSYEIEVNSIEIKHAMDLFEAKQYLKSISFDYRYYDYSY